MLHQECKLKPKEMLRSTGLQRDHIQRQISTFLIATALQEAFPDEVDLIFKDKSFPQMPQIDVLPRRKSAHHTLGPIKFSEGSAEGQYDVLNAIFCDQFRLHTNPADEATKATSNSTVDWSNRLYLVYGDQKTVQLIRSVQMERAEATRPFDRYSWILPIPALFHLRMNLIWGIQRVFQGTQATTDRSTLHHAKNILMRKQIPSYHGPVHHTQELIEHSFNARVVALLIIHLRQTGTRSPNNVARYLRGLTAAQFAETVEHIRTLCLDVHTTRFADDTEFYNHVKFMEVAEILMTLRHAIKYADIGLVRRVIDQCCVAFIGNKQSRYAAEMLRFRWLISSAACYPELQRAILANGLVNTSGRSDSWYPIDQMNEHLNLMLKEILFARRNSTFNVDYLFDSCTWTATYTTELRDSIERLLGERTKNEHTTRLRSDDIRSLAYNLADESLVYRSGRDSGFEARDILSKGYQDLAKTIERFNENFNRKPDNSMTLADDEGDMPPEIIESLAYVSFTPKLYSSPLTLQSDMF